jgi:aspartate/methionine/tyrosine aminotransferase
MRVMFMNAAEREQPPSSAQAAFARAQTRSAFARLNDLLAPIQPGQPALNCAVGEPQHAIPDFVGPVLAAHVHEFNKYPAVWGTDGFRQSVAAWAGRRYPGVTLDPASEVMVLSGSREGLFYATLAAAQWQRLSGRRKVLMPNPYYPPYAASARAANREGVTLDATPETGFLPDLDALTPDALDKTMCFILCSPANPQGAVASRGYLARALDLARKHGFLLFADECYSEIYSDTPPPGALEIAAATGSLANLVVFNSLSKRSNLAGLRIGFVAGCPAFLRHLAEFRNVSCPQVPLPTQAVAAAAYADETHVDASRALYAAKFDMAERILGNRFGAVRPGGGFFLWLDVRAAGGDEAVAKRLWTEAGLRVVPGSYIAATGADGRNPGAGFIRVALVHDLAITEEALNRLALTIR